MDTVCQPTSQPRSKRCYRSAEERRRIVEETLVPGTSVAIVARAHGVNANQVFGWRKLYQAGLLGSPKATSITKTSTRGPPRYECRPGAFKRLACSALFDCLERTEPDTDFDDNEDSLMVVCENAVKTVCTGGSKNEGPLQNVRRSRPQSASWLSVAGEIGCDRRSENEPCAVPVVTPACRRGLQSRQVSRRYPCEAAADRSWQSPRSLHSTMRCPEHLCAQGYP